MPIVHIEVEDGPLMLINSIDDIIYYAVPDDPSDVSEKDWKMAGRRNHPLTYKYIASIIKRELENANLRL